MVQPTLEEDGFGMGYNIGRYFPDESFFDIRDKNGYQMMQYGVTVGRVEFPWNMVLSIYRR